MVGFRAHGEVYVVVYDTKVDAMNTPGGDVYRYVDHKTEASMVAAKAFAPKRTGRLAGGIRKDVRTTSRDRVIGRVRSTRYYSQWVHEGTGPLIHAQGDYMNLPAYRGAAPGHRIKRAVVRGQAANPFLTEGLSVGMIQSYPNPLGPANPFL